MKLHKLTAQDRARQFSDDMYEDGGMYEKYSETVLTMFLWML